MPYKNIKELPKQVADLPTHAKKIFMQAFNNSHEKYGEESAFKIAWAAVKRKFHQDKDGKWVAKSDGLELVTFESLIVRAAVDPETGQMYWKSVASDTFLDAYEERMSIDLYQSFIDTFTGQEYLSISHYPSLGGKGVAGLVNKLYIDGNQFKTLGYFAETPLGKAAYHSVRKDRRENQNIKSRIRVSIGFYDRRHKHGENIWDYESGQLCIQCALKVKDKIYLRGRLEHVALTRVPVNRRTDIEVIERI